MDPKLDLTLEKETKYGRKTFTFCMTNHLQDKTSDGSAACKNIAEWIVDNAETSIWMNLPIWYITQSFRIVPINPTNPLWILLDDESRKKPLNWLIFQNHPKRSNKIYVTHFGPFGRTKDTEFEDKLRKNTTRFNEIMAKYLAIFNDEKVSDKQKEASKKEFQAHLDNNYIKAKNALHSEVAVLTATIKDVITVIYGTAEAGVVITTNLGLALAPSAIKIGCKTLFKETVSIIAKQLAKEIALISAKTAGKETGKVVGKKVPGVGLVIGVGCGAYRLFKGDVIGAVLEGYSGAASLIPGPGTVASLGIDAMLAAKDMIEALEQLKSHQFALQRASSAIVNLMEETNALEREHDLVKDVFFNGCFNHGDRGEEFVKAFQYLALRL